METTAIHTGEITMIALENLKPGRFNHRKHFDENAISELSESIRRQGKESARLMAQITTMKLSMASADSGHQKKPILWKFRQLSCRSQTTKHRKWQ